jgi:hypothetical protein
MSLVPLTDYNKFPDFVNSNKIIELISGNADLAKVREVISNAISTFIINHYGKQITNDTCIYVNVEKFRLNYNQIKLLNSELTDQGLRPMYELYVERDHWGEDHYAIIKETIEKFDALTNPLQYPIHYIYIYILDIYKCSKSNDKKSIPEQK